jgi:hypothetical protein
LSLLSMTAADDLDRTVTYPSRIAMRYGERTITR